MVANEKWPDNGGVVGTCAENKRRLLCETFIFQRKVKAKTLFGQGNVRVMNVATGNQVTELNKPIFFQNER